MYRVFFKTLPKVASYLAYQNSIIRKNFTVPFLKYKHLKLKLRVFLAGTSIYMLFTGREVRIEKNCARGLEYGPRPQAEGRTRDRGHSFSQYGPTKAGE